VLRGEKTETRNKLAECKYFLDILPTLTENLDGFRYNVSAFLNAWRSLLDVMLYDFDEFFNLGFTREVEMSDKEFCAVAKANGKEEALRFVRWWRQKQGMLKNSPLWEERIISFHRGGTNIQNYSAVVSGSGGNSSTIYGPVTTVPIPAGSSLNVLVPQIVSGEAIPTAHGLTPITAQGQATIAGVGRARVAPTWYFTDFPDKTVIEICTAAYAEWQEIVREAERDFHVHL
jgi:hypothetical protein